MWKPFFIRIILIILGCFFTGRPVAAETVVVDNFDYSRQRNVLTFSSAPKRIISMNGATTEMMLRLGLEKQLAGTAFLDNPVMPDLRAAYERVPILSAKYPNKEIVLYKEPDFIIGWRSAFAPQQLGDVHYWNKLGVNTFISKNTVLSPQKVSHFYDDIRDIGRIFNMQGKTEKYILDMESQISSIAEKLPPVDLRPTVLIAQFDQHGLFRAFASNTLAGDMLEIAGGRNAFPREGTYSMENLIQADPDIIIVTYMLQDRQSVNDKIEEITAHPILRKIKAARNGRIYSMPLAEVYSAGVRISEGIKRLATYLYPDRFEYEPL